MYLEAVLRGYKLFPVPVNVDLRQQLEKENDEVLLGKLASYKSLHNDTDTCERPRLIRAIEIEEYYMQHPELQEAVKPLPYIIFGLCGDRDLIRTRITQRLHERLDTGMIEEVQNLLDAGVSKHQLIRYGLEYKYVTQYLQGEMDYDTMFTLLNTAIHQFSKRQMTWFRRMERMGLTIHWIDVALPEDAKMEMIYKEIQR